MITIDPKFKKEIKKIRDFQKAHNDMIDYFIQNLGERAGLNTIEDHEILWDHILNESGWAVLYKKGGNNESSS